MPVRADPPRPRRVPHARRLFLPPSLTLVVVVLVVVLAAQERVEPVQQRLQRRRLRFAQVVVEWSRGIFEELVEDVTGR